METSPAFTRKRVPSLEWSMDTLPWLSKTVTSFESRKKEATVSRPKIIRLLLPTAITATPFLTCRLSPPKIVVLGKSVWPPTLAFTLPATEPITAEPASAGTVATTPIKRARIVRRNTLVFRVIIHNTPSDCGNEPASASDVAALFSPFRW
jgi:hypothetical protein